MNTENKVPSGSRYTRLYVIDPATFIQEEGLSMEGRTCTMNLHLERDSAASLVFIVLPGTDIDLNLNVVLAGEGADVVLSGAYLCNSAEKVNIAIDLVHKVPHCTSRQLFKGIVGGAAHTDFFGKITVAKDAQRTAAYQENHNLLLSEKAKVDTKPQLEIYADDVKCTHGATIGRLNEDEQFYMRSRGITLEEARVLQMISFLSPVLETIEDPEQRESLQKQLEEVVRHI